MSVDSPPASPQAGDSDSSPSTFTISTDADLANTNVGVSGSAQEDGPSAADYDPTMDMQEDKVREVSRQHEAEVPSSAYDETKNNVQDVLIPQAILEKPIAKVEFDMFAEDDDMFAEPSADGQGDGSNNMGRGIAVPSAKALDMSMLDDWDDEEGYYKIILGELLDSRYHVQLNLGKGMFSAVVRALDQVNNRLVAIKIIRSNETM